MAAARFAARDGLPPDTMWVVDLPGEASVAFGTALAQSAREPVSLVPTFNNWPAKNELVPAEETMAALATMLPPPVDASRGPSRPVFLLDAWRLAYPDDEPADEVYDNRYALGPADFPDPEALRGRGIRRVLYVVESRQTTPAEEDDLYTTFLAYKRAGIDIAIVDLDELTRDPWDWDDLFLNQQLVLGPRVTILERPSFYRLAHGGFGGIRAAPHIIASGVGVAHGFGGSHGFGAAEVTRATGRAAEAEERESPQACAKRKTESALPERVQIGHPVVP